MANFVLDITRIPDAASTDPDDSLTGSVSAYRFGGYVAADSQGVETGPSAGALVQGVIMDTLDADKVTAGGSVAVRVIGIAPVRLGTGGAATVGVELITAADGMAITGTNAGRIAGIAMQAGSAGSIIDVLLTPAGRVLA